jgi:glycosyltransferase involved in cell wall biosynthesis
MIKLRRGKVPTVLSQAVMPALPSTPLRRFLYLAAWRTQFALLDCVIANSAATAAELRSLGCRTRIEVISNGVDLDTYRPASPSERQEIRKRLGLAADRRSVLFVGTIVKRKGLDLLITAFSLLASRFSDLDLLVVGPRPEDIRSFSPDREYAEQIERQVSAGRLEGRVRFVGEVDDAADYYKASDVFVLPSVREGMPNVLLEAFASGLASVVTPFQGLDSQFGTAGKQYLIADRDPEALADCLAILLLDPIRARELGATARRWAEANFSMEDTIRRYAGIYRDLTLPSRGRPARHEVRRESE